jgi:hypothetical protein
MEGIEPRRAGRIVGGLWVRYKRRVRKMLVFWCSTKLPREIEPPTCGLQHRNQGIAQVVGDMGNPLVNPGDSQFYPFSSIRFSLPLIQSF